MNLNFARIIFTALSAALISINSPTAFAMESSNQTAFIATSHENHQVMILDESEAALEKRLEMIRNANQSIEIESYHFDTSKSARLVVQAILARKLKVPTLKVRILVDYFVKGGDTKAGLNPAIVSELAKSGIEVRYYNETSYLHFLLLDHRNHCKMFIVDDRELIIGSRNMSDEHFDLGRGFNFIDRDLWLNGPTAKNAREIFDLYWNSPLTAAPKSKFGKVVPFEFLTETYFDRSLLAIVDARGSAKLNQSKIFTTNSVTLAVDRPGNDPLDRVVTKYLNRQLKTVSKSLMIENYAYVPDAHRAEIVSNLLKAGVEVELMSSSYFLDRGATVFGLSWLHEVPAAKKGVKVYDFNVTQQETTLDGYSGESAYQVHTKTDVRDGRFVDLGSYNWDGRSQKINHEDLITVESPELAQAVRDSINKRITRSKPLRSDGKSDDGKSVFGEMHGVKLWLHEQSIFLINLVGREF